MEMNKKAMNEQMKDTEMNKTKTIDTKNVL